MAARTAVVAGTATAVSGRVARRQARRYDDREQQQAPEPEYEPDETAEPEDPDMARLQQLAELHKQGVLSDAEFASAKAKVLGI